HESAGECENDLRILHTKLGTRAHAFLDGGRAEPRRVHAVGDYSRGPRADRTKLFETLGVQGNGVSMTHGERSDESMTPRHHALTPSAVLSGKGTQQFSVR